MITLTSALTYGVGGVTQETADHGALVNGNESWTFAGGTGPGAGTSNRISGELGHGTWSAGPPGVFTKSARATSIWINLDLDTGQWTSSNGLSGTVPVAELVPLETAFKAIRNGVEQFAAAAGIMPGTQTPW
jgi:hypothetical protein